MARTQRSNTEAREISKRLLGVLQHELGLTLSEAARMMGYNGQATLQSIRAGKALPDAVRLSNFVNKYAAQNGKTINLHWMLTGSGPTFLDGMHEASRADHTTLDSDIINKSMRLSRDAKSALLTLMKELSHAS